MGNKTSSLDHNFKFGFFDELQKIAENADRGFNTHETNQEHLTNDLNLRNISSFIRDQLKRPVMDRKIPLSTTLDTFRMRNHVPGINQRRAKASRPAAATTTTKKPTPVSSHVSAHHGGH